MDWNYHLFSKINEFQGCNRWLDAFGRAGGEWVIVAMVAWYAVGNKLDLGTDTHLLVVRLVFFVIAWITGWAISNGIGLFVHEPRPFVTHPEAKTMFRPMGGKSFPSDHAMTAWLVFFLSFLFNVPGFEMLLPLALWVSWGRIFAGVHYPFDIVGGFFVAGLIFVLGTYISILYF